MPGPGVNSSRFRAATAVSVFFACSAAMIGSHWGLLRLPYFWDEAGQFIPQALDLLREGALVTHSAVPNIHPPLISALIATIWHVAGCRPIVTRITMLLLSSGGLAAAAALALELTGGRIRPAILAAALLFVSPLFFAQSLLAQLDAPAMGLTELALLCFLRERMDLSAAACVLLVLVKETGLAVPMVLGLWLVAERRWRAALLFAIPGLALVGWIWVLQRQAGFWAGNREFLEYNVYYPLNPIRAGLATGRRIYFLAVADFRWVGWGAMVYAWRRHGLFRTRSWRVAFALAGAHIALVTLLGGAVLERYLLPALPVLYAAMASAVFLLPQCTRAWAAAVLLAGLAISNFFNPPYPFPYENNLAFVDFLKLQEQGARFLEKNGLRRGVYTTWPLFAELSTPELGFVAQPVGVHLLQAVTPGELRRLDWRQVKTLVAYSRDWDPDFNLITWEPVNALWKECCGYLPALRPQDLTGAVPLPLRKRFTQNGQWLEIYAGTVPGL